MWKSVVPERGSRRVYPVNSMPYVLSVVLQRKSGASTAKARRAAAEGEPGVVAETCKGRDQKPKQTAAGMERKQTHKQWYSTQWFNKTKY